MGNAALSGHEPVRYAGQPEQLPESSGLRYRSHSAGRNESVSADPRLLHGHDESDVRNEAGLSLQRRMHRHGLDLHEHHRRNGVRAARRLLVAMSFSIFQRFV